jgi:hypothetical protein
MAVAAASLDDLRTRLSDNEASQVSMANFRPNIVVTGCDAFDEDKWMELRIGRAQFTSVKPCTRFVVILSLTTFRQNFDLGFKLLKVSASWKTFLRNKRIYCSCPSILVNPATAVKSATMQPMRTLREYLLSLLLITFQNFSFSTFPGLVSKIFLVQS